MLNHKQILSLAAVCTMTSLASAATVDLEYTGVAGALTVNVTGQGSYSAGHMNHTIYSGAVAVGSFQTFCIELGEYANNGVSTYEIVDLTSAPNPDHGTPYDSGQVDGVIDVIAMAVTLGWINSSLQNTGATSAQISAIQGAIWGALFNGVTASGDVSTAIGVLNNNSLVDGTELANNRNLMANRLRAVVATGEQDMLYVVPLPTSVWAGLGMLGGLAGIRIARRR